LDYPRDEMVFDSASGPLIARRDEGSILLDFPVDEWVTYEPPEGLLEALGTLEVIETLFTKRGKDIMLRVPDPDTIRALQPDFKDLLEATVGTEVNGLIATSEGEPPFDFISRFFAPWMGVDEDPVTGSAHTALTPYWSKILGKEEMRAHQASPRGGDLTVRMAEGDRVHLMGKTVVVIEGTMYLE